MIEHISSTSDADQDELCGALLVCPAASAWPLLALFDISVLVTLVHFASILKGSCGIWLVDHVAGFDGAHPRAEQHGRTGPLSPFRDPVVGRVL